MSAETAPHVFACIAAVSAEIAQTGIAKDRKNVQQGYSFRGIDDVYNALAPLLAKHGLVIIPRILQRELVERQTKSGNTLFDVTVEAEFDFVAAKDGSKVTARSFGEAMDSADKATNKAMSAAYKYTAFQTFCIPTEGDNDADATTHEETAHQRNEPQAQPQRETRDESQHGPRVIHAKIAKQGTSEKGPWTLYGISFSNGKEATTFSKSLYQAAQNAMRTGSEIEPIIETRNGKPVLIELRPIFRRDTAVAPEVPAETR